MIARLALTAALLGSAVGATAVLAADDDPSRKPKPPAVAAQTTPAPPRGEPIEVRNLRPVREIPDPEGGAPWAVRRFDTTVRTRTKTVRNACWVLGRLQGGAFGWIDGHGTFAERVPGRGELPITCGAIGLAEPVPIRYSTVTYPGGAPTPGTVVTWGVAPKSVTRVEIDGEAPIDVPADRFYLRIAPAHTYGRLGGAYIRADGTRTRFGDEALVHPRGGDRPVPGAGRVAVRAPDPAGGEPWGVLVQGGRRGGVCFSSPERLVGGLPGYVDRRLDLFMIFMGPEFSCSREAPTRAFPLRIDTMISGVGNNDDRGRIERRVLSTRIIFWGRAHPDVTSVTIRTPRDVRTLIPTRDHLVLAVYDGQFPGGDATATAHLRNGEEVTRSLYVE